MQHYWGRYNLAEDGVPWPLNRTDPAILRLHDLADRWFCHIPNGWSDQLDKMDTDRREARPRKPPLTPRERDDETKAAMRGNSKAQQDAEQFLRYILDGIHESYDKR
jgi:hypothetical protein